MDDRVRTGNEQDRKRINLGDERDLDYWMKSLKVGENELRALVELHGHSATIIREVLQRRRVA